MCRILIVDDDVLFGHMLADRLHREMGKDKLVVEESNSAEAARQMVQDATEPFDILLIDNRLGPGLSGIDLIEELHRDHGALDFVLFTGLDEPEIGLRAYVAGAFRYLVKPFDANELVWIIRSLMDRRATHYERNWLLLLTEVIENIQRATSVAEVGEALVCGGQHLGFERARFYHIEQREDDPPMFHGVSQAGCNLQDFECICEPVTKSVYWQKMYTAKEPCFFHSQALGSGFLSKRFPDEFPLPVGEWAGIPLRCEQDDKCLGTLFLDNALQERSLHPDQRHLLNLLMRQASIALEQVIRHEQKQLKHQALELVSQARQYAARQADKQSLDNLLTALYTQLIQTIPCDNFIALLGDNTSGWFHYSFHIDHGERQPRRWSRQKDGGLVTHLLQLGRSLFLPSAVVEYRMKHGIPQIGLQPAQSWMGTLLHVGEDIFGVLAFEHDELANAFHEDQFRLLQAVAEELAGAIQTTWLSEQAVQRGQRLTLLQQASETLMILAEENEDFLWHATLTLATAGYGFGFERAMLFLVDEGGTRLRGRMGIGNFKLEDAERDWRQDEADDMDFKMYLERLRSGVLRPTPVEICVRDWLIEVGPADGAFAKVLREGNVESVKAEQATTRLPNAFVDQFGVTDYDIVPCKAGARMIGLVVVDTFFQRHPPQHEFLASLDRLTNEVALIYENICKSQAQEQLIKITHKILVKANNRPLKETLQEICHAVQNIMGANLVAIYPLQDTPYPQFDHINTAIIGNVNDSHIGRPPRPDGLTKHILDDGNLVINDVSQEKRPFSGRPLIEHYIIAPERIRALIGVPVYDLLKPNVPRAVLYIDFRSVQKFMSQDIQLAESLAHLAAVAIKNYREAKGLRDAKEAREEELRLLGDVLQEALRYETNETTLIATLLKKTSELLQPLQVRVTILLRDWWHITEPSAEPVEVRREYYLAEDGNQAEPYLEKDLYRGISGFALQTGRIQHAPDVLADEWHNIFYDDNFGTRAELDIPIKLGEQTIGVVNVESPTVNAFTTEHAKMFERLTRAAALALDNVRRQQNLHTILKAAAAMAEPIVLEATLQAVLDAARDAAPDLSVLTIWNKSPVTGDLVLGKCFGVTYEDIITRERPMENDLVRSVMAAQKPIWAEDITCSDPLGQSDFVIREGLQSSVAFPLRAQDESIGVMFFSYRQFHTFTAEERAFFPILAQIAAASINDALMLEKAEKEHKRLEAVVKIAEAIGSNLELHETFRNILNRLIELFPNTTPCIVLYNEIERKLDFAPGVRKVYKIDHPDYVESDHIPLSTNSIAGTLALESRRRGIKLLSNVGDVYSQEYLLKTEPGKPGERFSADLKPTYLPLRQNIHSQFTITLFSERTKELLGVLVLEGEHPNAFSIDDELTIRGIAKQIRFILERHLLTQEIMRKNVFTKRSILSERFVHHAKTITGLVKNRTFRLKEEKRLSKRGHQLVDEIEKYLDDLKEEKIRLALQEEIIDLHELLQNCVTQTISQQDSTAQLSFMFCSRRLCVLGDRQSFYSVIRDIVRNSLEAMEGTSNPYIIVRTYEVDSSRCEIQIEDTGSGIRNPDTQRKLFNEVVTTKGEDRGRGCLLARETIEQMHGTINSLPYEEGKGAVIVINLPLTTDDQV